MLQISHKMPQANLTNRICQEHAHQDASSSDSDEVIDLDSPIDVDFPEETFYSQQLPQLRPEPQEQEQPREASPVPIVVSDIVTKSAAAFQIVGSPLLRAVAPKPPKVKMKTGHKGSKRPLDSGSSVVMVWDPQIRILLGTSLFCGVKTICLGLTSNLISQWPKGGKATDVTYLACTACGGSPMIRNGCAMMRLVSWPVLSLLSTRNSGCVDKSSSRTCLRCTQSLTSCPLSVGQNGLGHYTGTR